MQTRQEYVRTAIRLEYFTVGYNILEGIAALILGGVANSVALIGFGLDSFVETFSGFVVLRRFRAEAAGHCGETAEAKALRYVGWSFFVLAAYIAIDAGHKLLTAEHPDASAPGIALAALSLVIMPALAYRKRHAGRLLASAALVSDSKQTVVCAFLSIFLLAGLVLNAAFGWWWADPIGALAMLPWLIWEGREALSGKACCD
jgi:divalent metal cation (Fe/Co/Zn/Cd) transporter